MNGSSTAPVAFTKPAATTAAPAQAWRRAPSAATCRGRWGRREFFLTTSATAAIIKKVMTRSLWAPPSPYSTYSGLAPTATSATAGS